MRSRRLIKLVFLTVVLGTIGAAVAQDSNRQCLNRSGFVAIQNGKYDDAKSHFDAAKKNAVSAKAEDILLVHSHLGLARVLRHTAEYNDATKALGQAEVLFKKLKLDEWRSSALLANESALLSMAQGKYKEAESKLSKNLKFIEANGGKGHPDIAAVLDQLAGANQAQNRLTEAKKDYEQCLAIKQKSLCPGHPSVVITLHNFATLSVNPEGGKQSDKLGETIRLLKCHLSCMEVTHGVDHPFVATASMNLAVAFMQQGSPKGVKEQEPEEVKKRLEHCLTTFENKLGREHPNVATTKYWLGEWYRTYGPYGEAKAMDYHEQALKIRTKKLPPAHPDIATSRRALAEIAL